MAALQVVGRQLYFLSPLKGRRGAAWQDLALCPLQEHFQHMVGSLHATTKWYEAKQLKHLPLVQKRNTSLPRLVEEVIAVDALLLE